MATMFFGWPISSDTATLSGGSWLAGLPLSNLQTSLLAQVARSTDDANASTLINVDQGSAKAVSLVALVAHNMRSAATWRIRLSTVSNFASNVYDSGTIAVWPEQWPASVLPAGHPNAATRLLTDAQIDALNPKRDAIHVLATETSARYLRIELFDTANADTYVQAGRLVVAPRFQPTYNFSVGAETGFDDATVVSTAISRARFYDVRRRARTLALTFQNIPQAEAVAVFGEMLQQLGLDGQVYVVFDPADTWAMQRRSFLATLQQLAAVQYAAAGFASLPIGLQEVL
jgi:hypothetical protein